MPLIEYSDSEDEADSPDQVSFPGPSRALPPLPTTFHTLYATSVRSSTVDDPSLHSGRVRQIPHVDGVWPSHVQLEWHPSTHHHALLSDLFSQIQSLEAGFPQLHSLLVSPLGASAPLHISLSRTLPVLTKQRDGLLELLKEKIWELNISELRVKLDGGLYWASNADGSRYFLVVKPSKAYDSGREELGKLLAACNNAAIDSGVNTTGLYDDVYDGDGFHFSIAWCLGSGPQLNGPAHAPDAKRRQQSTPINDGTLQKCWETPAGRAVASIVVPFDRVMARIGNSVHAIELKRSLE